MTLWSHIVTRIGSLRTHPGKHELEASQAENEMNFQGVELRVGKNPVINSAQFIQAVVDLLKEKLFTTAANKSQSSVPETRKEAYNKLLNNIAVLKPEAWTNDNPRFEEDQVRELCRTLHVNQEETHHGFTEYKSTGGRNISDKMKRLF